MSWCDAQYVWVKQMGPHVPWQAAYAYVERMAKDFLTQHTGAHFTTLDLIEGLYDGTNDQTDNRIQAALNALAMHGLRDWFETESYAPGRTRKIWRAPEPKACPHCGGKL